MLKLKVYVEQRENGRTHYYAPIKNSFNNKITTFYLTVNFKKGMELKESAFIKINNFFFSCFEYKNIPALKIIVTDYEIIGNKEAVQDYKSEKEEYADFGDIEIPDENII